MNRALFAFLLRRHWLSLALLSLPPVLIGLIVGLLFPSYQESRSMFQDFLPNMQRLITGGVLDMFSATGMFSLVFVHPFTTASFACAAAVPALGLPAGERGRGGLDLLLATRLGRGELVRTVFVLQLAVAAVMAVTPFLGVCLGAWMADASQDLRLERFALVSVKAFVLVTWLGALALLLSVKCRDRGATALLYGLLVFGFLLMQLTAELWDPGKVLGWFNPFGFYRVALTLSGADGFPRDVMILVGTAAILAGTAVGMERRARSV